VPRHLLESVLGNISPYCCANEGKNEKGRRCKSGFVLPQEAARPNNLEREASAPKFGSQCQHTSNKLGRSARLDAQPTLQACKISHSRSNTNTAVRFSRSLSTGPFTRMTDDSNEGDCAFERPPLVRKKSGELVRPALKLSPTRRYNIVPGTPTDSRSVHFNDFDTQTRYFFQVDSAMDVSTDPPSVKSCESEAAHPLENSGRATRGMKIINLAQGSSERKFKPVRLERLFLSSDKDTLVGTVAVQNISFQKLVVAHFTLDCWKTTSELVAEYKKDTRNLLSDDCDRFSFRMDLAEIADIDEKSLLLCVRYNVNGNGYWDNNDDLNYHIEFTRVSEGSMRPPPDFHLDAGPLSPSPCILHPTSKSSRSHCLSQDIDNKLSARLDVSPTGQFDSVSKILANSGGSRKLDPKLDWNSVLPIARVQLHSDFGGRYSFDTSLSAASLTAR
jgi:hypothetical protein